MPLPEELFVEYFRAKVVEEVGIKNHLLGLGCLLLFLLLRRRLGNGNGGGIIYRNGDDSRIVVSR